MTSDLDLRERRELCDRFVALGPDAPTLCGGWTTADLAAHLVVRERDPIGGAGIMIPRFEDFTERRMAGELAKHGYAGTVERVRTGPPLGPLKIPTVRYHMNLIEFFVHHEDVRRANGDDPRRDRPDLDLELWGLLRRLAGLMVRKANVGGVHLRLVTPSGEEATAGRGGDEVRVLATPAELVLELYGRKGVTEVTYEGPDAAVAKVQAATFGL